MRWLGLAIVVSAVGCSDDKSKTEGSQQPAPTIDAAVTFDRARFCGGVFPAAAVGKVMGKKLESADLPSQGARVACRLRTGDDGDDQIRITLRVDCTESGVYSQREMVKAMTDTEMGSEYTDSELGKGGGKIYHSRFRSWMLSFNHAELPCAINLETENHPRDQLDALADIVLGRLTSSNRPR